MGNLPRQNTRGISRAGSQACDCIPTNDLHGNKSAIDVGQATVGELGFRTRLGKQWEMVGVSGPQADIFGFAHEHKLTETQAS